MSDLSVQRGALISQFEAHLAGAGHFFKYLESEQVPIDAVQPSHVTRYLTQELRQFARRHGHAPVSVDHWRGSHTAGVHGFLQCIVAQWPPSVTPAGPYEADCQALCTQYAQWLCEQRGLASQTIAERAAEAGRFLSWYGQRTEAGTLWTMAIADVDAYLQSRAPPLRRVSRKGVAQRLRCFLRFVRVTGRTERDFALCVMAPTLYAFESIPSALSPDQVEAVLQASRNDRTPKGLRDHAILLLLATYKMRAGEITGLQLNDIDWRGDRIFVRHTKTGAQSILPLLPVVGQALLAYLQRGRPTTDVRESSFECEPRIEGSSAARACTRRQGVGLTRRACCPTANADPMRFGMHARSACFARAHR